MKRRIIAAVSIIAFSAAVAFTSIQAEARKAYIEPMEGNPFEEPCKIRCTCYCEHGKTATGAKTRYGIVAAKKEWIGCTIEINAVAEDGSVGQLVGLFEVQDTGAGMDTDGDGYGDSIINGQSIDVWVASLSDAYEWRDTYGDYVYIKIFKAKG